MYTHTHTNTYTFMHACIFIAIQTESQRDRRRQRGCKCVASVVEVVAQNLALRQASFLSTSRGSTCLSTTSTTASASVFVRLYQ